MPDRLSGISSKATANLLARVAQTYESVAGNQIVFESVAGVEAAQRVADGENFDVVILAAAAIDKLISTGCLLAPRRDLMRSSTAVAVKAGGNCPNDRYC